MQKHNQGLGFIYGNASCSKDRAVSVQRVGLAEEAPIFSLFGGRPTHP